MDKKKPKWKRFEELVGEIQSELASGAEVKVDERIPGKSGVERQVDVAIRRKVGQYDLLIVMDCKDWKHPVDIKGLEAFVGLVEDVGANKGAMVCNKGFSEAAKTKAKEKGIDLFAAIDAKSKDWPVEVSMPTVVEFRGPSSFRLRFQSKGTPPILPGNVLSHVVRQESGEAVASVRTLIASAWNQSKLPDSPGAHVDVELWPTAFFQASPGVVGPVRITIEYTVSRRLYFGQWIMEEAKGFRDEHDGAFITKSFTTKSLDTEAVEQTWQRIESVEQLAVKPIVMLRGNDLIPVDDEVSI